MCMAQNELDMVFKNMWNSVHQTTFFILYKTMGNKYGKHYIFLTKYGVCFHKQNVHLKRNIKCISSLC